MRYTASVPTAVLVLLLTAACDSSSLVSPDAGEQDRPSAPKGQQIRTPDDEFARVARAEVLGFAGYYLQDDGTPVIRLVDVEQRGAAQRYLAQRLVAARTGGRNKGGSSQPVIEPSAFDFAQLKGWADGLKPMLTRDDVFTLDVDEKENRVLVGAEDAGAIAAVRAEASRLGIPAAALHVQTQPRPEQRITVQDWHNPLYGGIQIAFEQYVCTLGFNATRVATGQSIFVTNSHCTSPPIGSPIYQNTVAPGNLVGSKVAGLATPNRADAAYVAHNGSRGVSQGVIARTAWPNPISITEIASYRVTAVYRASAPVGAWIDKTGRTSGSTYGQVTNSCVTIGTLVCQDVSTVYSAGGDSGSPMYFWLGGSDVQLQGILWGGPSNNFNVTYSSPLIGIETDLGALTNLCAPGFGC